MEKFFEELFNYNQVVNEKLGLILKENQDKVLPRTIDLFDHILLVHRSWNNRMSGVDGLTDFWCHLSPELWLSYNEDNTGKSLDIIATHHLNDLYPYRNSKGTPFTSTFIDTCFHIINHSSYHRGQINMGLRSVGLEPVINEYIFYKR